MRLDTLPTETSCLPSFLSTSKGLKATPRPCLALLARGIHLKTGSFLWCLFRFFDDACYFRYIALRTLCVKGVSINTLKFSCYWTFRRLRWISWYECDWKSKTNLQETAVILIFHVNSQMFNTPCCCCDSDIVTVSTKTVIIQVLRTSRAIPCVRTDIGRKGKLGLGVGILRPHHTPYVICFDSGNQNRFLIDSHCIYKKEF